jgi:hypothetical protein
LAKNDCRILQQQIKGITKKKNTTPLLPKVDNEVFEKMQNFVSEYRTDLLSGIDIDSEQEYQAEEVKSIAEQALANIGAGDWSAVVARDGRTSISTDQESKKVLIPEARTMGGKYLEKIILHEIGVHVARRVNGERHENFLMGIGLDRYVLIEEGLAVAFEQGFDAEFASYARFDKHLMISLAMGADGQKRDFAEIFKLYSAVMIIVASVEEERALDESEIQDEREAAYDSCVRIFRGTDCKTPGAVYPKDLIYREGNVAIWNFIEQNPDFDLHKLLMGKYDPTREEHRKIALGE